MRLPVVVAVITITAAAAAAAAAATGMLLLTRLVSVRSVGRRPSHVSHPDIGLHHHI